MRVYRVHLMSWTASFRPPLTMYGYQTTLNAPPFSTVYGILSSACGRIVTPEDTQVGFVFLHKGNAVDLETIYEWQERNVSADKRMEMAKKGIPVPASKISKKNVIKREFLAFNDLYIYIVNKAIVECFKKPVFPLLIGRSSDLAFADEIKEVGLVERDASYVYPTTVLLEKVDKEQLSGDLKALPVYFSEEIPRKSELTRPFLVVNERQWYNEKGLVDEEKQWRVFILKF